MFTRPQPPLADPAAGISVASPVKPPSVAWLRLLKRGIAVGLLAVSGVAFLSQAGFVTSDNAVVTAHVVSLRAPIEGVVTARAGTVGAPVAAGARLASIINPMLDDRPVKDLDLQARRLRADLAALRAQHDGLRHLLADLQGRVDRHRTATEAQLDYQIARTARDRAAKVDQLRQLVRDMDRKQALRGTVPTVDIEQATTAVRVAAQQVASLDQQLAAARAAEASAQQGVLVEANGGNDVAYSEQRADEVRVRILDLDRQIEAKAAEATEAEGRLAAERAAYDRRHAAVLTVPAAGMIWRLGAGPGERVAPGDMLAQTVDCASAFLAVAVPQERLADIDLTAPATFRLAGEQTERTGHIAAITGESAVRGDGALAIVPAAGTRPTASVIVDVPPSENKVGACLVGRTARVLLRATRAGWIAWLRSWLPL